MDASLLELCLQKKKELGSGSFGKVYHVKGFIRDYAMKLLKCSIESLTMKDLDECLILFKLDHPNVVKVHGAGVYQSYGSHFNLIRYPLFQSVKEAQLGILLELCITDLFEELKVRNKNDVDRVWNIKVFRQMVEGVKYLHSKTIIHRDIKPANVLLNKNDLVKLTDFGLSKGGVFTAAAEHTKDLGTPLYMAPEVRRGQIYEESVDVYALGVTLLEMFSKRDDFNNWSESLNLNEVEYDTTMGQHKMDNDLASVVVRMTQTPEKRPTLDQVLQYVK